MDERLGVAIVPDCAHNQIFLAAELPHHVEVMRSTLAGGRVVDRQDAEMLCGVREFGQGQRDPERIPGFPLLSLLPWKDDAHRSPDRMQDEHWGPILSRY